MILSIDCRLWHTYHPDIDTHKQAALVVYNANFVWLAYVSLCYR